MKMSYGLLSLEPKDKDGNPIPNVYCAGSTVADSGSDLSPNAGSGLISGKAVVEALKA